MEKIKYRDLIMQYLTALEPDQTITTEQVAQYVAERLLLDAAMVKKTVNVNMARLEKEGQIMRLTKGIYCRREGDALHPTCIQNEFRKECRLRFGNRLS